MKHLGVALDIIPTRVDMKASGAGDATTLAATEGAAVWHTRVAYNHHDEARQ